MGKCVWALKDDDQDLPSFGDEMDENVWMFSIWMFALGGLALHWIECPISKILILRPNDNIFVWMCRY
jgi:hypothetical protein